jgi:hypothetical protein
MKGSSLLTTEQIEVIGKSQNKVSLSFCAIVKIGCYIKSNSGLIFLN